MAFQALGICFVKIAVHIAGLEARTQGTYSLVGATIFLLGFLLSGVLADFKESEKIPVELATSFESLSLEIQAIPVYNPGVEAEAAAAAAAAAIVDLGQGIFNWLMDKFSYEQLLKLYGEVHVDVVLVASKMHGDASTLRGRMMQELSAILMKINRIKTIRDTTFVPLVYWMAYSGAFLLFYELEVASFPNLIAGLFFVGALSFVVILLLRLISDIDNPFDFQSLGSAEVVSIEVFVQAIARLRAAL